MAGELCAGATCALQLWCKSLGPHKKRGALTTFDSLICSPFNTLAMVFFTPEPHGKEIIDIFLRPAARVCTPTSTTPSSPSEAPLAICFSMPRTTEECNDFERHFGNWHGVALLLTMPALRTGTPLFIQAAKMLHTHVEH